MIITVFILINKPIKVNKKKAASLIGAAQTLKTSETAFHSRFLSVAWH